MSTCTQCGAQFECGVADPQAAQPCWCTQLPVLPASELNREEEGRAARCYCPDCLRALLVQMKLTSA